MFLDDYLNTASELDNLVAIYNRNCDEYAGLVEALEVQRQEAQAAVRVSENLLNSIKRTPQQFAVELKELKSETGKFEAGSDNLKRAKTNIKYGAAGMGMLAAGGILLSVCTGLKDYIGGIIRNKRQTTKGKLLILTVLVLILFIPALILFFVVKHEIKKLQREIDTITRENSKVASAIEDCRQYKEKLSKRTLALTRRRASLESLRGCSFATLTEREQYSLMSLVRETRALAISINEVPEWL